MNYLNLGKKLENECDKKVYELLDQMNKELKENDLKMDSANEAEKQYKAEKSERRKQLIEKAMKDDARILQDPAPVVMLLELADSSVNFAVRPWVKAGDYWEVRSDLLETLKTRCDSEGISIPYPQQDVHIFQQANQDKNNGNEAIA